MPANIPRIENTIAISGVVDIILSRYKPAKNPKTIGKSSLMAISINMLFFLFLEV